MNAIAAVTVAIFGWIVSHALTLRAQRKNLENQNVDRARIEVAEALDRYGAWLDQLFREALTQERRLEEGEEADANAFSRNLRSLLDDVTMSLGWFAVLHSYELLFPETRSVRGKLWEKQVHIRDSVAGLVYAAADAAKQGDAKFDEHDYSADLQQLKDRVHEQSAVLSALRLHVQRTALLRIFSPRRAALPGAPDNFHPFLEEDAEGQLRIAQPRERE